ncbi:flagellar hook-length control protein FliK [Paraglaciecola hydrolytica]|uniref:Flagellar hook-length control protein-like C-terminal domain-containing protein n=1 Tax=Paraglaciecola hydrolytica TaxID=1799789 RepID=A0A148KNP3_9ALTE|nr:flagellar hook-length control protein FliK [Paraglaciecola hydrolytica]KXI27934.1 hypothetical protein AX660_20730 [Paraglaciecola hydrolytica]
MMQQVASAKADVAAFAALQGSSEQTESNLAFDQVLKQQQTVVPAARNVATKTTSTPVANKALEQKQTGVLDSSNNNHKKAEPSSVASQSNKQEKPQIQAAVEPPIDQEPVALDKAKSLDDSSAKETLVQSNEQWIDLVWSLQDISLDPEQTGITELTTSDDVIALEDINDLQTLQLWLATKDDKLAALAQLMEAKPTVGTWFAGTENTELQKLFNQVLTMANVTPTEVTTTNGSNINQELLAVSEDISLLLKNNRLSAAELELLNQALSQSLKQNTPLDPELKNLLQSKLDSVQTLTVEPGKNAKELLADKPIIVVPQRDDAGNILEANAAKIALPVQTAKEVLQSLLDKINGTANTSTEVSVAIQSSNDSQDEDEAVFNKMMTALLERSSTTGISTTVTNDKLAVSKESVNGNNPAMLKTTAAEIASVSNAELKALLTLSDDELDAALTSVAQRIAVLLRDESKSANSAVVKTSSDLGNTSSSKDVLAALKTGLAEFKDQLAAGHEPGIDLKALVTQALEKTTDSTVVAKVAEGLDKTLRTLSQSVSALNQLNDSASINQALNTAALDSQMTQAEQHKTMQLNQFDNKLDKALNLHKPEGHQQLADKVRWMVNTGNLIAEIRLDPAELGSVHVRVSLSAESATVNFVVQSQQTRDALEAATPKLREMLLEKGIELGQSTVKQDNQTKQDNQGQSGQQAKNAASGLATGELGEDDTRLLDNTSSKSGSTNAIDYFV